MLTQQPSPQSKSSKSSKSNKSKSNNILNQSIINTNPSSSSTNSTSTDYSATVLLPPIEMSADEQRALGYMPLRDDFEREYKNDAETLLSNLALANNQLVYLNKSTSNNAQDTSELDAESNSDDAIDYDLKLTLIHMYRECLMERQRFKK